MIRFFSLLTMTLLFAQVAWSRHLSPDEALGRLNDTSMSKIVSNKSGGSSRHELVRSVKAPGSTEADIYLFSDNAKRLVVLPADDSAPALLGYVDRQENAQERDVLPPAFEWWLEQYAAQIRYAQANPGAMAAAPAADRAPIEYLVKTRWNQSYPYNAQCPEFSGNQQAVTGCVATAFAQAMNYHQWPEQGRGSIYYGTRSMDFSEVTFDWASMLDEYDYEADRDSPEVEAVSTLMKACGYSVRMDYGVNWSGAYTGYIVEAAPEYFDYADEMYYAERRNYTSAQWEDLVYGQLAQGLPLIYSGRDGNYSNSSGHCFICDGYDGDGYYHFNWGWGGYCDGWFLLSALVPEGVGIGGAAGGYDYSQSLIVNFHPSSTTIEPSQGYINLGMLFSDDPKEVYADVVPERVSLAPAELNFGLEFLAGGNRVFVADMGNVEQRYEYYRLSHVLAYDVLSGMGLADGSYEVRFVYKDSGEWKTMMCQYGKQSSLGVDINAGNITISDVEKACPVKISDVDFNGHGIIFKNSPNEITYTATNTSDETVHWMSSLCLAPVGSDNFTTELSYGNLDLLPGETRTITESLGFYNMRFLDTDTEYYFMFRGGEESYNFIVYADQDVLFRVVDTTKDGISDGTFRYIEIGDNELFLTGLDSGVERLLSGDVVLPDQTEIDGKTYKIVSMTASFNNIIDVNQVTSLDIRTPIKSIPDEALYNSQSLTSVSFPSSLESIGNYAFKYCTNLGGELKLPESLVSIGAEAFEGCYSLTGSLNIPASVSYIGQAAFFNLVGLNGTLSLPPSLTNVDHYAFAYCYGLNGPLDIPSSVTSIGICAFRECGFSGSVVIPEGVRSIGNLAFDSCDGLTDVTMLPEKIPVIGVDAFTNSDETVAPKKFYVPAGAGAPYREALSGYSEDVYELGDANLSKSLTVADAVAVVNEIIGAPNATFDVKCGDINRDGRISISDATTVVSCVLKYNPGGIAASPAAKVSSSAAGRIIADSSDADEVALRLDGVDDVVAIQADVILDGGLDLDDIRLADSLKDTHTLQVARMADGSVRMIVFSMSNAKMALNGAPVAYIGVEDSTDASVGLQLANIVAVSADASERFLGFDGVGSAGLACDELASEKAHVSVAGGMLSVSNAAGALVKVYDLSGRLIMSFRPDSDAAMIQLDKGVYMISVNDREAVKIIL